MMFYVYFKIYNYMFCISLVTTIKNKRKTTHWLFIFRSYHCFISFQILYTTQQSLAHLLKPPLPYLDDPSTENVRGQLGNRQ